MAATLVADLRGECLRDISHSAGRHFQGLRSAAAFLRRGMLAPPAMIKKLVRFDDAFAVVRHITAIGAEDFRKQVCEALLRSDGKP